VRTAQRRRVLRARRAGSGCSEYQAASLAARPAASGDGPKKKRLTAFLEGFSLHAGVHLHANDRRGLEQLCRYGARGAIALSRLSELPDGRVAYHMKRPLPDGRTHLVLTGVELLRKLAPLIPPPRLHLLRFHGVFAPNAKLRPLVVPKSREITPTCEPKPESPSTEMADAATSSTTAREPSPYRLSWAAALRRVWGREIFDCARCAGRLTVVAFIEKASAVKAILDHLGLPSVPLPLVKARALHGRPSASERSSRPWRLWAAPARAHLVNPPPLLAVRGWCPSGGRA